MSLQVRRLGLVPYADGLELQRRLVEERKADRIPDTLLLLQHPHVLTLGVKKDGRSHILASPERWRRSASRCSRPAAAATSPITVPGQLVGYPIIDLDPDRRDVHRYVRDLEEVMIRVCADYGLDAGRVQGLQRRLGQERRGDEKIGAIGVRISRWITSHGFAFNVTTDLDFFNLIVPCGIADKGVTSLAVEARPRAGDGRGRGPLRRAVRGRLRSGQLKSSQRFSAPVISG